MPLSSISNFKYTAQIQTESFEHRPDPAQEKQPLLPARKSAYRENDSSSFMQSEQDKISPRQTQQRYRTVRQHKFSHRIQDPVHS